MINQNSLSVFILILRCPVENLPIGGYFDLPWRDRSRSFVMRPFCDFSNKLSKLHDSSKLKFCCLQNWRKKQFIFLLSTGPDHRPSTFSLETVGCVLLCTFFLAFYARSQTNALLARSTKNRARIGYVD